KAEIDRNIGDVEAALKTEDVNRIKEASEGLKKALQGVGQAIYGAAGGGDEGSGFDSSSFDGSGAEGSEAGQTGEAGSGAHHADENTVEGEFKEV
ncbi:MAG: hypothetical protein ACRDG4_19890, partial [Chloroflexota bacterium]